MQNIKVGDKVLTPDNFVGVVVAVKAIANQGTGQKRVEKAKVKYQPTALSSNESWYGLSQLRPFIIQMLEIKDEDAFEQGLDTEKVNKEIEPQKPNVVQTEPQDEASY